MAAPHHTPKLALLTNMVTPHRIPVYLGLGDAFDLLVLHGGTENNRDFWRDLDKMLPNAKVRQAWGWQIQTAKKQNGEFFDHRFLHITPGYIWHLLRFRPDVVISTEIGFRTLVSLTYGTLFRKPVWVWWGGTLHTERRIDFVRRALRKVVSRWARHWISYGQSSTNYLTSLKINRNSILQIQNAVDEDRFSAPVEPEFVLDPRPILLHVGQFIGRKGVDVLLRAAASLQKEGYEFSLLLVGSGRDKQALECLTAHLGLKNVHFQAPRPPQKMPSVFHSADVLIFPTLEDVWGLVANEAILSGLPVLCSKYAGCAEELFCSDNIFDPGDPTDFVKKLRRAVSGEIPKSDPSCLRTTSQIVEDIVQSLLSSVHGRTDHSKDVLVSRRSRLNDEDNAHKEPA